MNFLRSGEVEKVWGDPRSDVLNDILAIAPHAFVVCMPLVDLIGHNVGTKTLLRIDVDSVWMLQRVVTQIHLGVATTTHK